MKPLLLIGLVVLILGFMSLIVPIPQNERQGISIGDASLSVETRSEEKIHPGLSAVMILGGLATMAAGMRKHA